jgi:3-hydroxyacyl-CoA dehydrogenase
MGRGIAMCFADAGIRVALTETTQDALEAALATIEASYRSQASAAESTPQWRTRGLL